MAKVVIPVQLLLFTRSQTTSSGEKLKSVNTVLPPHVLLTATQTLGGRGGVVFDKYMMPTGIRNTNNIEHNGIDP